jgi:IS30 family transposase
MPRRAILREIDANRPVGHKLKSIDRASIVAASKCGVSIRNTARSLNFNTNTVKTTLRRDSIRQNNEALPRNGRPSKAKQKGYPKDCTICSNQSKTYIFANSREFSALPLRAYDQSNP